MRFGYHHSLDLRITVETTIANCCPIIPFWATSVLSQAGIAWSAMMGLALSRRMTFYDAWLYVPEEGQTAGAGRTMLRLERRGRQQLWIGTLCPLHVFLVLFVHDDALC